MSNQMHTFLGNQSCYAANLLNNRWEIQYNKKMLNENVILHISTYSMFQGEVKILSNVTGVKMMYHG